MRDQLLADLDFELEPISLPLRYRFGLAASAVGMLLLPLLYLSLIGLVGWLTWLHATRNVDFLLRDGPGLIKLVVYVAPIVAGGTGVLFMLKPFLARRPERFEPRDLAREYQPYLYEYVDTLCSTLGAPRPSRIVVDLQVNAAASLGNGLRGFLTGRPVLLLGLPLVASLRVDELSAILAHELGHFRQRSAMRFGAVIGSVNHWLARAVYERDVWDEYLEHLVNAGGFLWWQAIVGTASAFVWLTRKILQGLMHVGLVISGFLSRQMEYDADRYLASVAGSDGARPILLRLQLLAIAHAQAMQQLEANWGDRRLPDDITPLVVTEAGILDDMPDVVQGIATAAMAETTGRLDTHPCPSDRLAAIEARELPRRVASAASGTTLFQGFEELCHELTIEMYRSSLGDQFERRYLVPAPVLANERTTAHRRSRSIDRFFYGTKLLAVGMFPAARTLRLSGVEEARTALTTLRSRMAQTHGEVDQISSELDALAEKRRNTWFYARGSRIWTKLKPKDLGLTVEEAADLDGLMQAQEAERDRLITRLDRPRWLGEERLHIALAAAADPALGIAPFRESGVLPRLAGLYRVLEALEQQWGTLRSMQRAFLELQYLYETEPPSTKRGLLQESYQSLWATLGSDITALKSATESVPYPYLHGREQLTLAQYLFEEGLQGESHVESVAGVAMGKLFSLYLRIWSDLTALALEVEEKVGLPPVTDESIAALRGEPMAERSDEPGPPAATQEARNG